jgi:hypothetical protein
MVFLRTRELPSPPVHFLLAKPVEQCKKVLRGTVLDREVTAIRHLIYYQNARIIAESAFSASDGERSLEHRGDKKFYDSIPPLLPSAAATTAQAHPTETTWTGTT